MNAKKRPVSFYENGYDISGFDEIQVPQHIELAGYDKIHYINTMYPWEGHEYRRPAGTCNHIGEGMFSEPVQLWNCDDPKLYQVEIRIFDGQGPS